MKAKSLGTIVVALATLVSGVSAQAQAAPDSTRPRLIVLTDIGTEPDDIESMVRLLTYANEIDIEGLIAATSRHLRNKVHPELIEERVAAYGAVLPNLRVHDPRYPDAAALKAKIRAWRPEYGMAGVGRGKGNAASQLIIDAVDKADKRPVWVSVWGGAAPLAQALWTVQHSRKPAEVARFVSRLRVYTISDQDDSGPWARATFPQLFWVSSIHGFTNYPLAAWTGISTPLPGSDPAPVSRPWLRKNIQRGPLGSLYPLPMFIMEGDTPSFLNLIDNGLSSPERPDWGGWGGRWEKPSQDYGLWADAIDNVTGIDGKTYGDNKATVWRWRPAFQNDFAARIAWSVTAKYADANHAPDLVVNGQSGSAPVTIEACPGEAVTLSAAGSSDPDGQALTYRWWRYGDIGGFYSPPFDLVGADGPEATVTVKPWVQHYEFELAAHQRFHLILEARDSGAPALTRYRRVLLDIATDGRTVRGKACPRIAQQPEPKDIPFATGKVESNGAAWSSGGNTMGELLANPATRAVLERYLGGLVASSAAMPAAQGMTLRGLRAFVPELTDETLARIDAELAKLPE